MAKKRSIKIICLLLLIAFFVGVFLMIGKLSNNFQDDIKTFYLVIDGKIITDNVKDTSILGKTIEVHSLTSEKDFEYQIVPKSDKNFNFTVDNTQHAFTDKKDYTTGFDIAKTNKSITVNKSSMTDVLSKVYGNGDVELPELNNETCYFTLIVKLSDDKAISIDFYIQIHMEIELDQTGIVF